MNLQKALVKEVLEQPEWNRALAEHAEALERDPKDFRAWEAIGDLYVEAGKEDQALMVYEELLSGLEEEGRHLEALVVAQKMWRAKAQKVGLLKRIGELYLRQGLQAGGVQYLWRYAQEKQKRRQLEPFLRTCDQIVQTAESEEIRKQVDSLKRTLEELKVSHGFGEARPLPAPAPETAVKIRELHTMGAEHFRKGFWDTARKTYGKILTLYPQDLEALKMRLEIGLRTKDDQEISTAALRFSDVLQSLGRGSDAEETLRKILDKYPRLKEVRRRLEGFQRVDPEEAFTGLSHGIAMLGHLVDALPCASGSGYLDLGVFYRQAGLGEAAREEFERALGDSQTTRRAREELSLLGITDQGETLREESAIPGPTGEVELTVKAPVEEQALPTSLPEEPEAVAPPPEEPPKPAKKPPAIDKRIGFV